MQRQLHEEIATWFGDNPVVIHIQAAIDNANEDDDLPLAPWH